jgi:hypothetical protein
VASRVENATIVLCTTNSFKGDDAEIVVIADIEHIVAEKEILPHHLLVAVTRARSLLAVFAWGGIISRIVHFPVTARRLPRFRFYRNQVPAHQLLWPRAVVVGPQV